MRGRQQQLLLVHGRGVWILPVGHRWIFEHHPHRQQQQQCRGLLGQQACRKWPSQQQRRRRQQQQARGRLALTSAAGMHLTPGLLLYPWTAPASSSSSSIWRRYGIARSLLPLALSQQQRQQQLRASPLTAAPRSCTGQECALQVYMEALLA